MIKEELQRDKLRRRAGGWAWGYKKRLSEERGSDLAKKCWEEIKERRGGRTISEWERKKQKFFEDRGFIIEEVEKEREDGEWSFEKIIKREK